MLSQMRLLFLKGKETMKMLREQSMTRDGEEQVTETHCLAHEVVRCNLTNDKHILLLHDS